MCLHASVLQSERPSGAHTQSTYVQSDVHPAYSFLTVSFLEGQVGGSDNQNDQFFVYVCVSQRVHGRLQSAIDYLLTQNIWECFCWDFTLFCKHCFDPSDSCRDF